MGITVVPDANTMDCLTSGHMPGLTCLLYWVRIGTHSSFLPSNHTPLSSPSVPSEHENESFQPTNKSIAT